MSINNRLIGTGAAAAEPFYNTVLYTGNGNAGLQITGVGFQPDFIMIKCRSNTQYFYFWNVNRGAGRTISPAFINEEFQTNYLASFDEDGFTIGYGGNPVNSGGSTYVAYCWKASGEGAFNYEGTINNYVSANVQSGFSTFAYNGNGVVGATIGHGLSQEPELIIIKQYNSDSNWAVYSNSLGLNQHLFLNSGAAPITSTNVFKSVNSNVIGLGNDLMVNLQSNRKYLGYAFHSVEGVSKIGSYTGAAGQSIDFGFEPAFVMIKRIDTAYNWNIYDNKRGGAALAQRYMLIIHARDAEYTTPIVHIDFTSNGISFPNIYDGTNAIGGQYIYIAFANQFL